VIGAVQVTHPFHPRFGQEVEVAFRRRHWGDDRVFYRDCHGRLESIPTPWTSMVAEDPFVVVAAGRSRFRVADLLELAALVGRLRS